jgi:hypothetical protein
VTKYVVIIVLLLFAAAYVLVIGPRLEISHRERINGRMSLLRDRVKANPSDTNALCMMVQSLQSKDSWEKVAAVAYLGQVGCRAEPATDGLIQALNGADLYAAREAAKSLGEIGPGARRAIPALTNAVRRHADADIGWFAAESLGQIADPDDAAVALLLKQAAASSDERMVYSANEGIEALKARRQNNEEHTTNKLR